MVGHIPFSMPVYRLERMADTSGGFYYRPQGGDKGNPFNGNPTLENSCHVLYAL
jgi:hypothetical protein